MKTFYIAMIAFALSLGGCNESSSQSSSTTTSSNEVAMVIDKSYEVNEGDRVEKRTDDATLKIKKNSEKSTSEVILLRGEAVLIRK